MSNYYFRLILKTLITVIIYFIIIPKLIPNNEILQYVVSSIFTEILFDYIDFDNLDLYKIIGGEVNFCKTICVSEDNPEKCQEICNKNNYISSNIKGGNENDYSDINLICKNICKNNKYDINCIKNCEIDFKTI